MEDYLSTREAAVKLCLSYSTLMWWIYSSRIRAVRRGQWWFIHKSEVARVMAERAA